MPSARFRLALNIIVAGIVLSIATSLIINLSKSLAAESQSQDPVVQNATQRVEQGRQAQASRSN